MSIFDYLRLNALKHPNKVALILDDNTYTYEEIFNLTKKIINNFIKYKVTNKSVILLIDDNSLSHILTLLAASYLNACVVPVNDYYNKNHLKKIINISKANYIIGDKDNCKYFKNNKKIKNFLCIDNNKNFNYFFEKNISNKIIKRKIDIEKNYIITFTSGSTANPKAIIFSQRTKIERFKLFKKLYKINNNDKLIITSPIDHSLGMRMYFVPLLTGCTFVLMRKFSAELYLDMIKKYSINFSILVANQITEIVKNKKLFKKFFLKKALVSASASLNQHIKKRILTKKINLYEMYGAAEIGTVTSFNINNEKRFIGSVGKIYDKRIEIKILSDKNRLLPYGHIGEIICKTPASFKGYLSLSNKLKLNKEFYFKNYFKTGDLGYLNDKNYLFFIGRKKNIKRRNGITIYPEDIEKELTQNQKIKEVATCSVEKDGKDNVYLFVKKEKGVNYEFIRNLCLKKLSTFQIPNHIILIDKFPKTNLGKIDKITLIKSLI